MTAIRMIISPLCYSNTVGANYWLTKLEQECDDKHTDVNEVIMPKLNCQKFTILNQEMYTPPAEPNMESTQEISGCENLPQLSAP